MQTKNGNSLTTRRDFLGAAGAAMAISGCGKAETHEAQFSVEKRSHQSLAAIDMTYTLKLNRANPHQLHEIWDAAHVLAALQGLANRDRATIYQFFIGGDSGSIDHFWWHWMRGRHNWLNGEVIQPSKTLRHLILEYRHRVRGLVVYDEHVPSTSNVASTVAGVEDLLPVRFDKSRRSLFYWLTGDPKGPKFPVKVWLIHPDGSPLFTGQGIVPGTTTPSTKSAKCDAYIWAKELYLDTGRCNPAKMGYYIDAYWLQKPSGYIPNHTLSNHDYFIAHRGFFFDLDPWADEVPIDDPTQPLGTDQRTLRAILRSAWNQTHGKRMIHIGGFPPWDKKYTRYPGAGGKHGGVATEWEYAYIVSCFNGYMDADALGLGCMANASLYQHYPLKASYPQQLPTKQDLQQRQIINPQGYVAEKSYVTIYVGDYDSAAWLYQMLPTMWTDPARGSIPLGWAFDPNLSDRFAPGMVYARDNKTPNDHFITGDSGAGYLNPGALQTPRKFSGLPSGIDTWRAHCEKYYRLWDVKLTGFIIDGDAPAMNDQVKAAYAKFSPDGIVPQKIPPRGVFDGMPFLRMGNLPGNGNSPADAAKAILQETTAKGAQFRIYRTVLKTPTWHKELFEILKKSPQGTRIEIVEPYSLMLLLKYFYEG
ncbi:MAG: GxGYxYP domain-containing protein [Phycisphaerae bacterium]